MSGRHPFDPETTPLEGTVLLEASAGTGKTWALERMVARLVGRGDDALDIGDILVVTFTNRAAREMKERIRTLLRERSGDANRDTDERKRYARALAGFDRAPIHTIHGFCRMVLSTWPFESSSPFRQELEPGKVLEDRETRSWLAGLTREETDDAMLRAAYRRAGSAEGLVSSIVKELTRDDIPPGSLVLPTPGQSEVFADFIETSRSPGSALNWAAEILAGRPWSDDGMKGLLKAASGKTRTKAPASLEKIRDHLTACRGASGLIEIADSFFGDPAGVDVRNHFLDLMRAGVTMVRNGAVRPDFLSGDGESSDLAAALAEFFSAMEPYVEITGNPDVPVDCLVDSYLDCAFIDSARRAVEARVEKVKRSEGTWGYADLIRRVSEAVSAEPSALRSLLRRRFRAALIDEFQDTDPRQWELFRTLFGGPDHLLILIGDPKQSIYGFRGTGLQAYNAARGTVDAARVHRLDTNYRSVPALVAETNRFFAPLFSTAGRGNRPVGFEAVGCGKTGAPVLTMGTEALPPLAITGIPPEGPGKTAERAADAVVTEIRELLDPRDGGTWRIAGGQSSPVAASDIAVLVRRAQQEEDMIARLDASGIPSIRIRSRSVFERPAAVLMRGLLEALARPRSMARWRSVLLGGLFGLSPRLLRLFEEAGRLDELVERGESWRDAFLDGRVSEALDSFFLFAPRLAEWAAAAGRSDAVPSLDRPWPARVLAGPDGERQWQDWNHLADLLQQEQARGLRDPADLAAWMDESAGSGDAEGRDDALRLETDAPAVRVMTMHTSKGLEFPIVFVLGGLGGADSRGRDSEYRFDDGGRLTVDRLVRESYRTSHLMYAWEEDKRLWYVAFTRASAALRIYRPLDGPVLQVESLLAGAVGLDTDHGLPPHQCIAPADAEAFRAGLEEALAVWTDDSGGKTLLRTGGLQYRPPLAAPVPPEPRPAPLPADRPGDRDPATSSYTSVIRAAGGDRPHGTDETEDRDMDGDDAVPRTVPPEGGGEALPLERDRGALFGTLVHALFETCSFTAARNDDESAWMADSGIEELFSGLARRYYPPDWYRSRGPALKKLVRSALRAPIPDLGRLCDLEDRERRAEAEFLISLPDESRLTAGELEVRIPRGFLKGFIDLLIRTDDRWWVLDWKTNVPPDAASAGDYTPEAVEAMMESHHYHLQYELYLLSLCRELAAGRGRPVDWHNEIGGAAYLFVRGMRETDDRGILVAKPTRERMADLAGRAGLEGVIA